MFQFGCHKAPRHHFVFRQGSLGYHGHIEQRGRSACILSCLYYRLLLLGQLCFHGVEWRGYWHLHTGSQVRGHSSGLGCELRSGYQPSHCKFRLVGWCTFLNITIDTSRLFSISWTLLKAWRKKRIAAGAAYCVHYYRWSRLTNFISNDESVQCIFPAHTHTF